MTKNGVLRFFIFLFFAVGAASSQWKDNHFHMIRSGYDGRKDKSNTSSDQGRLHIFENIYIPRANEPCYSIATDSGRFSHARYGFLRPSYSTSYNNKALCHQWPKIQVDFDSRQEAIKANLNWITHHKKLVLVIPQSAYDSKIGLGDPASIAAFLVSQANGLMGLLNLKPVDHQTIEEEKVCGPNPQKPVMYNGAWNSARNTAEKKHY